MVIQSVCDRNPCKNDGACIIKYSNNNQTAECICQTLYYGKFCEKGNKSIHLNQFILNAKLKIINKVAQTCNENNQCLNGATCVQYNLTHVECSCAQGFTGEICENDIDECLSNELNTCPRNSVCKNTIGSYKCNLITLK